MNQGGPGRTRACGSPHSTRARPPVRIRRKKHRVRHHSTRARPPWCRRWDEPDPDRDRATRPPTTPRQAPASGSIARTAAISSAIAPGSDARWASRIGTAPGCRSPRRTVRSSNPVTVRFSPNVPAAKAIQTFREIGTGSAGRTARTAPIAPTTRRRFVLERTGRPLLRDDLVRTDDLDPDDQPVGTPLPRSPPARWSGPDCRASHPIRLVPFRPESNRRFMPTAPSRRSVPPRHVSKGVDRGERGR